MQFQESGKAVETIEKGDLLTVVGERDQAYVILTLHGARGLVGKVNTLKLAEAVEVYDELISETPKEGRLYRCACGLVGTRGQSTGPGGF